jgi:hypothetical protein
VKSTESKVQTKTGSTDRRALAIDTIPTGFVSFINFGYLCVCTVVGKGDPIGVAVFPAKLGTIISDQQ